MIKEILKTIFSTEMGSVYSFFSLILTIIIYFSIKHIKTFYKSKVRLPQLLSKIKESTSRISNCLNDFDGFKDEAKLELGKIEANLKSLRSHKVDKILKSSVNVVIQKINSTTNLNSDDLRSIYIDMNKLIEEINNILEDINWEAK